MGAQLMGELMDTNHRREEGFVLVTALTMLGLLTLLMLGMFFSTRTATKTSGAAQASTEAYYYAETAINYISWGFANDAEFDNYAYTGTYIHGAFGEPLTPTNAASTGDYNEWGGYMWSPGPTSISDSGTGLDGQVLYFDNSPMGGRTICFESADLFANCIDVTKDPEVRVAPSMYNISVNLPRYIRLDIASDGTITPTIPQLPHQDPPVVGQDIPENGAVVWVTAGDPNNTERDIEIFPLDPANAYGGTAPTACAGGQMPSCPCNYAAINVSSTVACEAHANGDATTGSNMGGWVSGYRIVAYALGYVNGKPSQLIRAVVR